MGTRGQRLAIDIILKMFKIGGDSSKIIAKITAAAKKETGKASKANLVKDVKLPPPKTKTEPAPAADNTTFREPAPAAAPLDEADPRSLQA